jgi:hypothetical protein
MQPNPRGAQFFCSVAKNEWREQQQADSILKEHQWSRGHVRSGFAKRAHNGDAQERHDNQKYSFGQICCRCGRNVWVGHGGIHA